MTVLIKKAIKTLAIPAAFITAMTIGGIGSSSAFASSYHPAPSNALKQTNTSSTSVYGMHNTTGTLQGNTLLGSSAGGVTQGNKASTNVGGVCNTTGTSQDNFLVPTRTRTSSGATQTNTSSTNVGGAGNVTSTTQSNVSVPSLHM